MHHPQDYPTSAHLIDQWAVKLPPVFKDMLVERKPIALIILAYWAVLTSINPRPWHLKGLAEVLIARIQDILGEEWAEFLRWPRERVTENARAAQDELVEVPRFDNRNIDNQLHGMQVSHESSFSRPSLETRVSQPSPYKIANGQSNSHGSTSNHPSPYLSASEHPSPYTVGSNVHSPFGQDPPTG
ncbi:hypothetical protein KCU77_g2729, partial [Aureobasidium melanogenum]